MARYGQHFKERVVARLLPPESSPVEVVSQTVGISVATLERWRKAQRYQRRREIQIAHSDFLTTAGTSSATAFRFLGGRL